MRLLDLESLLHLTKMLSAGPVRDPGLLASAAARPTMTVFGDEAYPGLHAKAAAILHSIVRNHPLVDGNKRLGWLACVVTLDLNGVTVTLADEDAFQLVMSVAEGDLDEVADIAAALEAGSEPRG